VEIAQAELELAIHHLKQVEERISAQREKIARMRADGLSPETEEKRLGALLRSLETVKTHLANVIDSANPQNSSN
jgi:predicted  nucleic acid-binding Zn-ribbon protein